MNLKKLHPKENWRRMWCRGELHASWKQQSAGIFELLIVHKCPAYDDSLFLCLLHYYLNMYPPHWCLAQLIKLLSMHWIFQVFQSVFGFLDPNMTIQSNCKSWDLKHPFIKKNYPTWETGIGNHVLHTLLRRASFSILIFRLYLTYSWFVYGNMWTSFSCIICEMELEIADFANPVFRDLVGCDRSRTWMFAPRTGNIGPL